MLSRDGNKVTAGAECFCPPAKYFAKKAWKVLNLQEESRIFGEQSTK